MPIFPRLRSIAVCCCVLALASTAARADDFDRIRDNFVRFETASDQPRTQPLISAAVAKLGSDAQSALGTMQSDGHWTDVDYAQVPGGGWSMETHYRRVLSLARAYRTPGQPLYNSESARAAVEKALTYAGHYVYSGCPTPGNWWHWEVTVPFSTLGPILLLMQGNLSPSVFNAQRDTQRYLVGLDIRGGGYSGQNLVWKAMSRLYTGVLDKNEELVAEARENIASVCAPGEEDGIQADFSFHQHGALLATASYGGDFAEAVGLHFIFTDGTGQRAPDDALAGYVNFVADGIRWALYQNHFDLFSLGRAATRQGINGRLGLDAMLIVSSFPNARRDECAAAARKMLETFPEALPVWYAGLAGRLSSGPGPAWPVGCRIYPQSDWAIHRAPNWFMSIKMISERTMAAELVNDEGKQSWHMADGAMYLVQRGDEYLGDNVLPTLDWQRLPGTTVEHRYFGSKENYGFGSRAFVGGASIGPGGVAAMDFRPNASPIQGRRSWFFFDNEVAFLGEGLTCTSESPVETIVNQWPDESTPMSTDAGALQVSPKSTDIPVKKPLWMHSDGIGYYFPTREPVVVRRETRAGRWIDIGASGTSSFTHTFLQIRVDHGESPEGAGYAYVIVPGVNAATMAAYAASPPVSILRRDESAHAVRQAALGEVGAVFWAPGSVDRVTANHPCVVFYREKGPEFRIAAADPAQTGQDLRLVVNESLAPLHVDPGMSASSDGTQTTITIRARQGRSYMGVFRTGAGASDQLLGGEGGATDVT
ncbi:MAG: hypothetical protein JO102_01475, partial [Elusimicrobia bacterium]|nr:hypothetical protein [Elusimicrobiota bacterium]